MVRLVRLEVVDLQPGLELQEVMLVLVLQDRETLVDRVVHLALAVAVAVLNYLVYHQ
jgi:hypothetical protein